MISTLTGRLIKIAMSALMCIIIATAFSACSTRNTENTVANQNVQTNENVLVFDGVRYPINSSLDFNVAGVEYFEAYADEYSGDSRVTYIIFSSGDRWDYDNESSIENGGIVTQIQIAFVYIGTYSDVINGNGKISGSYKVTSELSEYEERFLEGIMYDEKGDIIFKAALNQITEWGLAHYYYDKNDIPIVEYYGYDKENELSLWIDRNGNLLNNYELYELLAAKSPELLEEYIIMY